MAYIKFDETKPDAATQNGAQVCLSTQQNLTALRDMVLFGAPEGWNMSVDPADATFPDKYIFTGTNERIEASMNWNADNTVDSVSFNYFPSATGGTAEPIGTVTFTYNASKAVTATTWS
jgi:hypothetical protein